jgi:hypothetical protein
MKRYQIYYRLVDISFAITAFWLAFKVLGLFAPGIPDRIPLLRPIWDVVFPFNILFAIVLVLARRMRDEHAERVWQITARRFVNFIMVAPLLACAAIALFVDDIRRHAAEFLPAGLNEILQEEPSQLTVFIGGIGATMVLATVLIPQLFVVFYRWGLWRDSR